MVERGRLGESELRLGVHQGIQESLRCGTTAVGDISSAGVSGRILREAPLRGIVFEEAIGLDPERVESVVSQVRLRMQETDAHARPGLRAGLSPHAPYSVSSSLLERLVAVRDAESRPLAMHLSESEEEITHVESGQGPLYELLVSRGLLPLGATGHGLSPVAFAAAAGVLRGGALLVHLNYLTGADLDLLAAHRHEITAVFCPRSHEFFGHAPHPLQDLLRRGIRVALGTDGRSSNDALCMFREMSRVREIAPDLSAPAILGLATTSGAIALGLGGDAGSLETSRYADLTARTLPLPVQEASDDRILEALVSGETEPRLTMVGGQVVSETVGRPGRSRSRKESR